MAKLELLKPKVRELAEQLLEKCVQSGNPVVITQTLRTKEEQDALYAQGRTKPGDIVTNARGGYSFHNYGVAFDFCPLVKGKLAWDNTKLFKIVGKMGVELGLEWGGAWKSFKDLPHFQYTMGYAIGDFLKNKVDCGKFELDSAAPILLKVKAADGLNVRKGPGAGYAKIGKLDNGQLVSPLEKKSGWVKISYKGIFGWASKEYLA